MTNEKRKIIEKLLASPTFNHLAISAMDMPIDTCNPDELKVALGNYAFRMLDALDEERIHFDDAKDRGVLFATLTLIIDYVMAGKLKNTVVSATVN